MYKSQFTRTWYSYSRVLCALWDDHVAEEKMMAIGGRDDPAGRALIRCVLAAFLRTH